jgi:hypothetical protein
VTNSGTKPAVILPSESKEAEKIVKKRVRKGNLETPGKRRKSGGSAR